MEFVARMGENVDTVARRWWQNRRRIYIVRAQDFRPTPVLINAETVITELKVGKNGSARSTPWSVN